MKCGKVMMAKKPYRNPELVETLILMISYCTPDSAMAYDWMAPSFSGVDNKYYSGTSTYPQRARLCWNEIPETTRQDYSLHVFVQPNKALTLVVKHRDGQ
jgi:hypothetical protein